MKNNYSKRITHGEAVLGGIILATRLSVLKKICSLKVLKDIEEIYLNNKLEYTYSKFSKAKTIINLIPFLINDKKNTDNKINFILLKNNGRTTDPNSTKISISNLKNYSKISHNTNFKSVYFSF